MATDVKRGIRLSKTEIAQTILIAVILEGFFFAYRALAIGFYSNVDFFSAMGLMLSSSKYILLLILSFITLLVLVFFYMRNRETINGVLYKWRWVFAGIVLLLLTVFEISGSSLAMWARSLPDSSAQGLLFGEPRWMRTDEWATTLPMIFAQFNDESGYLPYVGEVFRGTSTDMFWLGLPVLDIASIFKPFSWGYLIFGMAKGFAFSWSATFVLCFMLVFETGMKLLKGSRSLSVALALMVAFSPAVTWWNMGNHVVYICALFLVALLFFKSTTTLKRFLSATFFFYVLTCYALCFYPAWQVPFGLTIALCGIVYLIQNKKDYCFRPMQMVLCCIPGIILLFGGIAYVFYTSADSIAAITSTVYPGKRTDFGGGDVDALFRYPLYLFTPLDAQGLVSGRQDAISSFFDLAPLGLFLAAYLIFVKKRRDGLLITLVLIDIFFLIYYLVGFPEWLAKITLMSFSTAERMVVVIGFVNLLLLFKAVSLLSEEVPKRSFGVVVAVVLAASVVCYTHFLEPEYFGVLKMLASFMVIAVFAFVLVAAKKHWIVILSLGVALFGGALVAPVQMGVSAVQDNEMISDIRDIKSQSSEKWISETDWAENIPTLAGAPTISSTHSYPDMALWKILDPDGSEEYIYNRYAHLRFKVADVESPEIILQHQDVIAVTVPLSLLDDLDVGYILSMGDLSSLNDNDSGVKFDVLKQYPGYTIYEVEYL